MDLAYVPHHGSSNYANAEFFKRVRARYYVFSGVEPSREVFNALLEAKRTWENKEQGWTILFLSNATQLCFPRLVSNCKFRVIDVRYILSLRCGGAAKVISSSWQQFSAAGSGTFLQNCQILRHTGSSFGHKSILFPKSQISQNSLLCFRSPSSLHTFSFHKDKG